MFKAFEFCIQTVGKSVPSGSEWFHEIKYDGYRIRLERDADRVRLITKGGYDWTKRYPRIVEAALRNRQRHFVIDGEAIIRGVDGYSDFNALHSGKHNDEVELVDTRKPKAYFIALLPCQLVPSEITLLKAAIWTQKTCALPSPGVPLMDSHPLEWQLASLHGQSRPN